MKNKKLSKAKKEFIDVLLMQDWPMSVSEISAITGVSYGNIYYYKQKDEIVSYKTYKRALERANECRTLLAKLQSKTKL